MSNIGVQLRVKGKVQGVGFRPYVWQLAHRLSLSGDVCNDSEGVLIRLLKTDKVTEFVKLLYQEIPPLARIDDIIDGPFLWEVDLPAGFTIRESQHSKMDTQIIPDAATCDACLFELFQQTNRRYHYPFINCTHCGPRFTIVKKMPYDRANTSMSLFPFCDVCQTEYQLPADRRFHAQPNACAICGPHIWSCYQDGQILGERQAALLQAADILLRGGILAIKGIGGFHLACDATNEAAIHELRQRKRRPTKPFAVMLPDLSWLAQCADDSEPLRRLLTSAAAPIVLINRKRDAPISKLIAPGLSEIGVMLPSNPLQHLLFSLVQKPLIMTSANASGKPPALSNATALLELRGIADMWLLHNREIVQRADDSLLRYSDRTIEVIRRARGYVPDSMPLPDGFQSSPSILAIGADLKNTFCLLRDNSAVLSQHIGDLSDLDIQAQLESSIALFKDLYRFDPRAVAVDAHPGYISHKIGKKIARQRSLPLIKVLHHHAHIASCLAEHGWQRNAGPVIGIAVDGLGYGANGQLWGGECLLVDYHRCIHLGGLPPVALPGGDLASRQPWRSLLAQMLQFVPQWQQYSQIHRLLSKPVSLLQNTISKNINSPYASSTGRLFDAVAAALGICFDRISWEGEAACQLEALAAHSQQRVSPVSMPILNNRLDLATFWQQWLNYRASNENKAYAFHEALAEGFARLALTHCKQYGLKTVVLSGGVMHNRLFRRLIMSRLHGLNVLVPKMLPMGDGGIALGQAVVAAACFEK